MTMRVNHMVLLLIFSFLVNGLTAQMATSPPESVFCYLTKEEAPKIYLEMDMEALLQNRKKAEYLPATLTDATGQTFELEVRSRGKFRRRKCEIPPLKLKFSHQSLQSAQLDTINEIKLVLPCANNSLAEELILREYAAYRMFENLNPACVRARLIRLYLKDGKKKKPQLMTAMLVEHEEEIVKRLHSTTVTEWGIKPAQLDQDQAALMVLFQYMIGNTDWDLSACRNILLLQPEKTGKIMTVPFDFDFSGLVSAPYASPNSESGLTTVKDRCLMANGLDTAALLRARTTFLITKPRFYEWCQNIAVSKEANREMTAFLDAFFSVLEKNEEIPAQIKFDVK